MKIDLNEEKKDMNWNGGKKTEKILNGWKNLNRNWWNGNY